MNNPLKHYPAQPTHFAYGKDRLQHDADNLGNAALAPKQSFSSLPLDDQLLRTAMMFDGSEEQGVKRFGLYCDTPIFDFKKCPEDAYDCLQSFVVGSLTSYLDADQQLWLVLLVRATLLSEWQLKWEGVLKNWKDFGLDYLCPTTGLNYLLGDFTD